MTGPDLRSTAFRVLLALAVGENRNGRGNMAPATKAFHHQRPQAIAATGLRQPAATGHCSHRLPQRARAPRRAADRMDTAAMPRSSKAIRKAATYRDHRRRRRRLHPPQFSLKTATGPPTLYKDDHTATACPGAGLRTVAPSAMGAALQAKLQT